MCGDGLAQSLFTLRETGRSDDDAGSEQVISATFQAIWTAASDSSGQWITICVGGDWAPIRVERVVDPPGYPLR